MEKKSVVYMRGDLHERVKEFSKKTGMKIYRIYEEGISDLIEKYEKEEKEK